MKHRILFVCHGNICRSPMAEFVMKDLVKKVGLEDEFYIESAATSTEEIGNGVYPPARRKLAEHGIGCRGKTARQMTRSDYDRFDLLVGMDSWNIRNMKNICGSDPEGLRVGDQRSGMGKIVKLMDFTNRPGDVADPWYTGDFEATWKDVLEGCQGILDSCMKNVEIVSARPEDTDFIAWIVAQGMHTDSVPPFLKKLGVRDDTLYSWRNTRFLRCDGKLAGGLVSYDGATHEERRRNTWVMPDGRLLSSGDVPETTAGEYYLDSLAIVPEFRGHGLWRMLFDDAVGIAKRKGFHRVTLICDKSYPKLAQLYTSYGFVPENTFSYFDTLCRKMSLAI